MKSDILSMRYDPTGSQVAIGTIGGNLRLYTTNQGLLNKELIQEEVGSKAISHVRWNPVSMYYKYVDQHLLTSVHSDGLIESWFPSDKVPISRIDFHQATNNKITAADYSCDGQNFTVAAADYDIYSYDIVTGQQKLAMPRSMRVPNHTNVISCLKHHPTDANLLVTGGWDSCIKLYDLRHKGPICSMMTNGSICGDSIDMFDDMIVTGSHKSSKDCMQIFSFSRQCLVHEWSWNQRKPSDIQSGYVMTTKFSKDGQYIIAGGQGMNEIKVFANDADSDAKFPTQFELRSLPSPVFDIDVRPNEQQFTFGLGKGKSFICTYKDNDVKNKHINYNGNFDCYALKAEQEKRA